MLFWLYHGLVACCLCKQPSTSAELVLVSLVCSKEYRAVLQRIFSCIQQIRSAIMIQTRMWLYHYLSIRSSMRCRSVRPFSTYKYGSLTDEPFHTPAAPVYCQQQINTVQLLSCFKWPSEYWKYNLDPDWQSFNYLISVGTIHKCVFCGILQYGGLRYQDNWTYSPSLFAMTITTIMIFMDVILWYRRPNAVNFCPVNVGNDTITTVVFRHYCFILSLSDWFSHDDCWFTFSWRDDFTCQSQRVSRCGRWLPE